MKTPDRSASLELLLDVLCNTLGGVIFLALLVILIARSALPGVGSRTEQTLAAQIAELTAEKAALQSRLAAERGSNPSAVPASAAARQEIGKLEAELTTLRRERTELEKRLAATQPQPRSAQAEFASFAGTAKKPFWLIVTRRHLFRAGAAADFPVAGRPEAALVAADRRTGSDGAAYWILTPRRGWPLDTPEAVRLAAERATKGCDPEKQFLAVLVAPDGVADFWQLRALFRRSGFAMAPQLTLPGDLTLRETAAPHYEAMP